ncbi:hypothetical protein RhiirA4_458470 [Rhizophagus irregularis]|uniref:Uncharacterized protein n=1 Tax=Rhizophagus irregularis TaxID=588596 RepID=A0A2I1GC93_9GLOM|nr:hypothetical protein RhiirA4_458470 [Rhizophagus irregularis]
MILQTFLQILEKNTLTKIAKLEKQLKLLKEQTSKDNKKQNSEKQKTFEAVEQSDENPKQSPIKEICKHKINCKKKQLYLEKNLLNGLHPSTFNIEWIYAMRHICKEHLTEIANTTMYKDIDAGLLNNMIDKISKE